MSHKTQMRIYVGMYVHVLQLRNIVNKWQYIIKQYSKDKNIRKHGDNNNLLLMKMRLHYRSYNTKKRKR